MLQPEEKRRYMVLQRAIMSLREEYGTLLMRGTYRGESAAIVVIYDANSKHPIKPVAVLLTPEQARDVLGPDDNPIGGMVDGSVVERTNLLSPPVDAECLGD